jgi:hypothetical protein
MAAGGMTQVHVDALFLSLTASRIMHLQPMNKTSLQGGIAHEYGNETNNYSFIDAHIGLPHYKRGNAWRGINLFPEHRVRRRNPVSLSAAINNN